MIRLLAHFKRLGAVVGSIHHQKKKVGSYQILIARKSASIATALAVSQEGICLACGVFAAST
ncbi:hypothetical protein JOD29_003745 [Lysinibacillus composti]|uniref:Uncharacterized protein n=1 Tax=Lysinibacillus composti TaxID=720633 RepID=A0A3N9UR60_9BACI|nr:hypothetical protein [Lysinibacillus composti]MBM7610463.1 hypothetical protein [Lysinibacillus composti]RQW74386.1 hypothetical protein EBB45_12370 [Lysinibacillus composti]